MAAGGGDLQRQHRRCVAAHVDQVRLGQSARRLRPRRWQVGYPAAGEDRCCLAEAAHAGHLEPADERRLTRSLARHDQMREPRSPRPLRDRKGTRRVPKLAAQRQLAEHRVGGERLGRYLTARRQQRQRDRGVETRTHLAQERRRQVRGDAPLGELEVGVENGGLDAVSRLPHGGVAEAHDRERRKSGADVDLDPDVARIDAIDRECRHSCEHASKLRGKV